MPGQIGEPLLDDQHVGDERAQHRHLALGEVDDAGRLVDQHQRQRDGGVDEAVVQPVEDTLQEQREALLETEVDRQHDEDRQPDAEVAEALGTDALERGVPLADVLVGLLDGLVDVHRSPSVPEVGATDGVVVAQVVGLA